MKYIRLIYDGCAPRAPKTSIFQEIDGKGLELDNWMFCVVCTHQTIFLVKPEVWKFYLKIPKINMEKFEISFQIRDCCIYNLHHKKYSPINSQHGKHTTVVLFVSFCGIDI